MGFEYLEFSGEEIDKVDVTCKVFKIRLVNSATEKIEVSWTDTEVRKLEISNHGRKLQITDHAAVGIYNRLGLITLKKENLLLIKIPLNYHGEIILQTLSQPIGLSDLSLSGNLHIITNTGKVLADRTHAEQMDVRDNYGKICFSDVSVEKALAISSKNGNVQCYLQGNESDYTILCATKRHDHGTTWRCGAGPKVIRVLSERGHVRLLVQDTGDGLENTSLHQNYHVIVDW